MFTKSIQDSIQFYFCTVANNLYTKQSPQSQGPHISTRIPHRSETHTSLKRIKRLDELSLSLETAATPTVTELPASLYERTKPTLEINTLHSVTTSQPLHSVHLVGCAVEGKRRSGAFPSHGGLPSELTKPTQPESGRIISLIYLRS